MENITEFIRQLNGIVSGPILLPLLAGAGLFLTIGLRLTTLRRIPYAFRMLWDGRKKTDQTGDISPFNALMTAMSATVGTGNIAPALVHFNVGCVDGNDDLRLLLELQQHLHLAVRLEAGQDARGVIVVKKLAAEFQIELAAEMRDALQDPFGLQLQILLIVKSNFHKSFPV